MPSFSTTHQKKDSEPNTDRVGHGLLDYSAFPHLIEAIAKFADHNTRLAFRQTCKSLRDVTDALFPEGENVILELGNLSGELGSDPVSSIKDVLPNPRLVKHGIPALYNLRSLEVASLHAGHDMTQPELYEARLKALARASGFTLSGNYLISDGAPTTKGIMMELANFVRRSIGRNISLLRIKSHVPPTTMLFEDIETLVMSTAANTYDPRWPQALVHTKNVAKIVLAVKYKNHGVVRGSMGPRAPWPAPVHFSSPQEDSPPELVGIFKGYSMKNRPTSPTGYPAAEVPLGFLHDLVQEIIRNCYSVTFVGALDIPPRMLAFDDRGLSGNTFKDIIVRTACSMVDRWSDLNGTAKPNWTRELAKTAICNIKFYTHDEYREAVGVEQYDQETK